MVVWNDWFLDALNLGQWSPKCRMLQRELTTVYVTSNVVPNT
jgi:hypothetical protein